MNADRQVRIEEAERFAAYRTSMWAKAQGVNVSADEVLTLERARSLSLPMTDYFCQAAYEKFRELTMTTPETREGEL